MITDRIVDLLILKYKWRINKINGNLIYYIKPISRSKLFYKLKFKMDRRLIGIDSDYISEAITIFLRDKI